MFIVFSFAFYEIFDEAVSNLLKLLRNHRATRIASTVEAISVMPAMILEVVG